MSSSEIFAEPVLDTDDYLQEYKDLLAELDEGGLLPPLDLILEYKVYTIFAEINLEHISRSFSPQMTSILSLLSLASSKSTANCTSIQSRSLLINLRRIECSTAWKHQCHRPGANWEGNSSDEEIRKLLQTLQQLPRLL